MKFSGPLEDIVVTGSVDFTAATVQGIADDIRQITGDGVTVTFTILHGLDTTTPAVHVFDDGAAAEVLSPRPSNITANAFDLVFAAAPAVGATFTVRTQA